MKLRVFLFAILASLWQFAFADGMPPEPERCPSASSLGSMPFIFAQKPEEAPGYLAMAIPNNYGTKDTWALVMGFIESDDLLNAIMEANKHLGDISGTPEPFPVEEQKVWMCGYHVTGTMYQAIAITPLPTGGIKSHAANLLRRAHA